MNAVFDVMERLRKDGWCVVLKCLPDDFPWLAAGDPSEYGGGSDDTVLSREPWCAECQDMRHGKNIFDFRRSQSATGGTPDEAMARLAGAVAEEEKHKR